MTRSVKILGLHKGTLSVGADADITIYDSRLSDIEEMFAHPTCNWDGVVVVEDGNIKEYTWGKTQVVRPEYDTAIEKVRYAF